MEKHALIVNQSSGNYSEKDAKIVSDILQCKIYGDAKNKKESQECAKYLFGKVDVLNVLGGDGFLSDIFNVAPNKSKIGFIPKGTGNAFGYSFNLPTSPIKAAKKILNGKDRKVRLILCNEETKAFMASIGIEGYGLRLRDERMKLGEKGKFLTYAKIVSDFITGKEKYDSFSATINIDGKEFFRENIWSFVALKSPFYGMGLHVAPEASLDAEKMSTISYGKKDLLKILISSKLPKKTFGGERKFAEYIEIQTSKDVRFQWDGEFSEEKNKFTFKALKDYVYFRC